MAKHADANLIPSLTLSARLPLACFLSICRASIDGIDGLTLGLTGLITEAESRITQRADMQEKVIMRIAQQVDVMQAQLNAGPAQGGRGAQ